MLHFVTLPKEQRRFVRFKTGIVKAHKKGKKQTQSPNGGGRLHSILIRFKNFIKGETL